MCRLQVIECDFSYAGCNEKVQRQDMEKHVEENTQKHLALVAAASMKTNREFEKKLQDQQDEFRGYLEQKERETAEQLKQIKAVEERLQQSVREKEEQIENMRKTLQKEHEKQIKALKEQIVQLEKQLKEKEQELEHLNMKLGMPPFHFTM